jgi:3-oxoacyl-[acyl-carrier-protein] synthase II
MSQIPVVVTGMGTVSPLGSNLTDSWSALLAGEGRRCRVDLFDTEGCRCREAAQAVMPTAPKNGRRISRASRMAMAAAQEALHQSGLLDSETARRAPISISTTGGAMEWGETFARGSLAGKNTGLLAAAARYQPQQQVQDLCLALDLQGPRTLIGNACASGANAIGHGYDLIRAGVADCVIAGGYEALTELIFMGFDCLQALSTEICRPFDEKRDGLMLGEGAAFLILETEASARARGASILGRLLGYGHSTDTHHLTQPEPSGKALIRAMHEALTDSGLTPDRIGYLNAHGTGTPMNDGAEALAYCALFGSDLSRLAISSTKAAVGHTLGAAGCLEAVFALMTARERSAPPQLNNREPLKEVAASLVKERRILSAGTAVMSVNMGFGGSNAALVIST